MEATAGLEPADKGFADLCLTTWLCRQKTKNEKNGADYRARTGHLDLGKVALYRMS